MQLLGLCNSEVDFRLRLFRHPQYRFALYPFMSSVLIPAVSLAAATWLCLNPIPKQIRKNIFLRALTQPGVLNNELFESKPSFLEFDLMCS
jgi:hypothetical protein